MDLLDAVNKILPKLGEHPVTNLDTKHPTLAIILPVIDSTINEILLRGWWFNEYDLTIYPDSEKMAAVPSNAIEFLPDEEGPVVRGLSFFNTRTGTYLFDAPFKGTLKERLEFEELPESVAYLVLYTALVEVYCTDIGLEAVVQQWDRMRQSSDAAACSEHLRNKRHTTKKSKRYRRYIAALRS